MYVVSETSMERIFEHIAATEPGLVVVDSIQTVNTETIESGSGSVSQIRECTTMFQHYAKESGIPCSSWATSPRTAPSPAPR